MNSRPSASHRLAATLLGALLLATLLADDLSAFDVSKPPTPADADRITAVGFAPAKKQLEQALLAHPDPAKLRPLGAWLDLWRWADLLARDASEENTALAQRHFFRDKTTGQIFFLPLDQSPTQQLEPLEDSLARQLANDSGARAEMTRSLLPPGEALPTGSLAAIAGETLVHDMLRSPAFSKAFFSTISPRDHLGLVLKNLRAIHQAHREDFFEFQHLAIAIAVVNDSALHPAWPHTQVTRQLVPLDLPPVATQFSRWVAAARAKHLLSDIRKLPPDQLKFVIDAFVTPEELSWARKHIRHPRSRFGKTFDDVAYREDRIATGRFHWTATPYSLASILKQGGICVDQAYFAMIAGKAHGLPTLFFTGQGPDGGHAWFGYLRSEDRWELDCGRFSRQHYAIGRALDPQTWQPVSDHELQLLAASFRHRPPFAESMNLLTLSGIAESAGQHDRASRMLAQALKICPENPDPWEATIAFHERTGAPPATRMALHRDAIRRFATTPDLKVRHQLALAALQRSSGESSAARNTEALVVSQNKNRRSDLSVGVAAMQVQSALEQGDLDKAALEFHKKLQTIGQKGGGEFVKEVGFSFVQALIDSGNKTRARRTVSIMRQKFNPSPASPLDRSLAEMEAMCD